ncbi:MAG: ATP-binding protein [Cyanobacteria bacterium P01_H01_bin.119]
MQLSLPQFYQACNPSRALRLGGDDQGYYIDFSSVRGGSLIQELGRTIAWLSPDRPTCQLFTGHVGCGKSTELMCLKAQLIKDSFHVVYFESSEDLDLADVDVTDILLAIARQVYDSLAACGIALELPYFQALFQSVGDIFRLALAPETVLNAAQFSAAIAAITATTRDSPKLRRQLRQYLEPRTNGILNALNQELIEPAIAALEQRGQRGLVVIIDNLDRIDNVVGDAGRYQPSYLFVDRGEQLKKLNCHVVYTLPLELVFSSDAALISNRFGVVPKVLTMVPVRDRSGQPDAQGLTLLRQLVLARAFPNATAEQRLAGINQVFDRPGTLDRLCSISGGHIRNLLVLLYRCLQRADLPLPRNCLEEIILQRQSELLLALTAAEIESLQQVQAQKHFRRGPTYQTLLRSMYVFEYRSGGSSWFDINPVLAEMPDFQQREL